MATPPPLSEIVETPIEQSPEQTPRTPNVGNAPVVNYGPEVHRTADRASAVRPDLRRWTIGVSRQYSTAPARSWGSTKALRIIVHEPQRGYAWVQPRS